eukprot:gene9448-1654_t
MFASKSSQESGDDACVMIELICGEDFKAKEENGTRNSYVIFKTPNTSVKSKTVSKNLYPVWNQTLHLTIPKEQIKNDGRIEIECYDSHFLGSKDLIGKTSINIRELRDEETSFEKNFDIEKTGLLVFKMTAINFESVSEFMGIIKASAEELVLNKLKESKNSGLGEKILKQWSENLSDENKLKEKYLTTNWMESMKFQETINQSFNYQPSDEREDIRKRVTMISKEEETFTGTHRFTKELKIKLLFVDHIKDDKLQNNLRKLFSPLISEIGDYTKFGMFHTALLIGPWLLEWNDSALCIPRKCVSKSAFLTADIGEITTKETLESVREKIAKVITNWNVNYSYSMILKTNNHTGNCQTFVDEMLKELGIELKFDGAMAKFINTLKKNGSSKLIYHLSDDIKYLIESSKSEIEFQTHQELDNFIVKLLEIEPTFAKEYKHDFNLLKSFDRALWLKFLKSQDEINYLTGKIEFLEAKYDFKPTTKLFEKIQNHKALLASQEKINEITKPIGEFTMFECADCPFGHPAETKSFW